jgi:hypothetical protein
MRLSTTTKAILKLQNPKHVAALVAILWTAFSVAGGFFLRGFAENALSFQKEV